MTYEEDIQVIIKHRVKRKKSSYSKGDKTNPTCPRCGIKKFIFDGKTKRCLWCGFDNSGERLVKGIKYLYRRGRTVEVSKVMARDVADYVRNLMELN